MSINPEDAQNLDDALFPPANAENYCRIYTDEYNVNYVCDWIEEFGYCWVGLGPAAGR